MTPRIDLYRLIHKALRAQMAQTLVTVGRADCEDDGEVAQALEQVELLGELCRANILHENEFIHRAIEERAPGASMHAAYDHLHHQTAIASLSELCLSITRARSLGRSVLFDQLYRQLARFVEENYEHMRYEETENNAILWAAYSDDELRRIERQLIAAVPGDMLARYLRCLIPNVSHAERIDVLLAVRASTAPEAFSAMIESLEAHLNPREADKLRSGLGLLPDARVAA